MLYQVMKGIVKYEGASHQKGSLFDANQRDVGHLVKGGFIRKHQPLDADDESQPFGDEGDDGDDLPSPDEFAKLPAGKQKEWLKELELEPAANAEDRVVQYTEYYVAAGEDDGV